MIGVGTHARALLEREIGSHREVVSIPGLRMMHVGPDDVLVACRVEFREDLAVPAEVELTGRIIDDLPRRDPVIGECFSSSRRPGASERPDHPANVPGPAPEEACDGRSAGEAPAPGRGRGARIPDAAAAKTGRLDHRRPG